MAGKVNDTKIKPAAPQPVNQYPGGVPPAGMGKQLHDAMRGGTTKK